MNVVTVDLQRRRCLVGALLAAGGVSAAALAVAADAGYETLAWAALLPANWDPQKSLASFDLERFEEGDSEGLRVLRELRAVWDDAPAVPALERRRVRLAGFMLPLATDAQLIRDFLLMPYFGACLHEPAPPANQTVRVVPARPIPLAERGTSAVVVSGTLHVERSPSSLGVAAYRLAADTVEPRRG